MAMAMHQYPTERIDTCVMLSASIEATGHHNWSNIYSVSPRGPPVSHTNKQKTQSKQMHLTCWPFWWPRQWAGTLPRTSTNAPSSALQLKPLYTTIGRIFAPYCPGNRRGPIQADKRTQSNDKTNIKTYIHSTSQKRQMSCLFYFPRLNFAPEIGSHTSSAQKTNYQGNHLHSL